MTKFYVPHAKDDAEAESVLDAIAKFIEAPFPPPARRIRKITWVHNGKRHSVEVGQTVDSYFGGEEAIAILESGSCYCICTPNRGVICGGPILTNKLDHTAVVYFDGPSDQAA